MSQSYEKKTPNEREEGEIPIESNYNSPKNLNVIYQFKHYNIFFFK